ncbi:MAG TPA: PadR family transcriptional regulator [Steroidobacteraceae bacterium]|nr:PadR family transcriptional regulator [Steroidobacteraceae bacterium]
MALRHVVLTVLARGEMSGYEIAKNFETVYSHFWRASHQQVYKELARLNAEGRVSVKVVAQRNRPDKKVYTLTKRGIEELREWLVSPTEFPLPRYDFLVKLLAQHVADRKSFQRECDRILTSAREWLRTLRAMRRECLRERERGWSDHDSVLYLALRRGLLLGEAQVRWLNEIQRYLASGKLPD